MELIDVLKYLVPEEWDDNMFLSKCLFLCYLQDCCPSIEIEFPENLEDIIREEYEENICLGNIRPRLFREYCYDSKQELEEYATKLNADILGEFTQDKNLLLSFKDHLSENVELLCNFPISEGFSFKKGLLIRKSIMDLGALLSSTRDSAIVLSPCSGYYDNAQQILDMMGYQSDKSLYLVCGKADRLPKCLFGFHNGGLSRVEKIYENEHGILIKLSYDVFLERCRYALQNYNSLETPPSVSHISMNNGQESSMFNDYYCFSLFPSDYDGFTENENNLHIEQKIKKELHKAGILNGIVFMIIHDINVDVHACYFQNYTKLGEWLNDHKTIKPNKLLLVSHPSLSKEDCLKMIDIWKKAFSKIDRPLTLDFIEYWIRHTKMSEHLVLSSDDARSILKRILLDIGDNTLIDNYYGLKRDHRDIVDWIIDCEDCIERKHINLEHYRVLLKNKKDVNGTPITQKQTDNLIQYLLLTSIGISDITDKISKRKFYIRSKWSK